MIDFQRELEVIEDCTEMSRIADEFFDFNHVSYRKRYRDKRIDVWSRINHWNRNNVLNHSWVNLYIPFIHNGIIIQIAKVNPYDTWP